MTPLPFFHDELEREYRQMRRHKPRVKLTIPRPHNLPLVLAFTLGFSIWLGLAWFVYFALHGGAR